MVVFSVEGDRDGRFLYIVKVVDVYKISDVYIMIIYWWYTDNKNFFKGRYVSEYEVFSIFSKVGRVVRLRV